MLTPRGLLASAFSCPHEELGWRIRDGLSHCDREQLEECFSRPGDYAVDYSWGSMFLHERATRTPAGFVCIVSVASAGRGADQMALLAQAHPEPASLIGRDHQYQCVNQAWRESFGPGPAGLAQNSLALDLGPELYENRLRPLLDRAFAGTQQSQELWLDDQVNGKRCLKFIFSPCPQRVGEVDQVVMFTRDVTELRRAGQALHHSVRSANELRDRVSLALEVAEIGIWSLDFKSRALHWDEVMCKIYGRDPGSEMTLESWRELVQPEDRHHLGELFAAHTPVPERQVVHYRVQRQDGDVRFVKTVYGSVLQDDGSACGLVGASVDVTELHEIQEALLRANHTAEEANRAKTQFLTTVSHEIRTPMNAILGLVHLARMTDLTPRQDDYLAKLERSAGSLLDIINDILDFSKIEAGKLSLESVDFRMGEMLDHLGQMLQVRARDKPGLEILLSVDSDVPELLRGDPLRLGQVLLNLGGNAVKFTECGEVVVSVRLLHQDAQSVILEFAVTDTGIGLQPEQIARLFQPFSQADNSTARKYGGTGLGLSICQQLVDLMGGHIWAEGRAVGGARFVFTARLEPARDQDLARERTFAPEHDNLRVLIVDDNFSARRILAAMIEGFGFQADLAESGEQATELAEAQRYDLILMDWRLTGMDGIEASRIIRGRSGGKDPVILLVTAYEGEELGAELQAARIDGLLRKPLTESNLYDAIAVALHRRERDEAGLPEIRPRPRQPDSRYQARVLLVEDNDINRQVGSEMLALRGIQVTGAGSALEALGYLNKQTFELIFMDVQMPGMDGLEATRRIRANSALRQIPIIALTANAMKGDRERCLQAGMTDYLSKPIDSQALQDVLRKYLGSPSLASASAVEVGEQDTVLDTRAALDRLGGNAPLYLKLLSQFQVKHSQSALVLAETLAGAEREVARGLVHTLQGSAANLGMNRVADRARSLEQLIHSGAAVPQGLVAELQREIDRALQSIEAMQAMQTPERTREVRFGSDLLERLKELQSLLRVDVGRAHRLSQLLLADHSGPPWSEHLNQIHAHIYEFSLDEAEEALTLLLQEIQAPQEGAERRPG